MAQSIDISFNSGVNNEKPDTTNTNGEISLSFGLTSKEAVMAATKPSATHLYHIDGCQVLLIHSGSAFKNIFVYDPTTDILLAYKYEDLLLSSDTTPTPLMQCQGKPTSTAVIGNIVVLSFQDTMRYAYRTTDRYILRANKLPHISMRIKAACRVASQFDKGGVSGSGAYPDGIYFLSGSTVTTGFSTHGLTKKGENRSFMTPSETETAIMATFTKMIADWGQYGYLFSPVIVRAAYKLKSGEIASLTNPILCYPFSQPTLAAAEIGDSGFIFRAIAYKLYAHFDSIAPYQNYKDIIDSVEIYMSTPIYTHTTDPLDIRYEPYSSKDYMGFQGFFNQDGITNLITLGNTDNLSYDNLEKVFTFYKVHSIPFDEDINRSNTSRWLADDNYRNEIYFSAAGVKDSLATYRKLLTRTAERDVDVTSEALATRPVMTDTLRSNLQFYSTKVAAYNSRLIAVGSKYNIQAIKNIGLSYFESLSRLCSLEGVPTVPRDFEGRTLYSAVAKGTDKQSGNTVYFTPNYLVADNCIPKYLTIEEPNVESLTGLVITDSGRKLATLSFKTHQYLNLSYFNGEVTYQDAESKEGDTVPAAWLEYKDLLEKASDPQNQIIGRDDYIRESNVADPYTFDDANTAYFNSAVTDIIIVSEAISLGQYGSNQMFAICHEGIYTVDINSEGKLSSVHTYSKDIIQHPERSCVFGSQLVSATQTGWHIYRGQTKSTLLPLVHNFAFTYDNLPILQKISKGEPWENVLEPNILYDFMHSCALRADGQNRQLVAVSTLGKLIAILNPSFGLYLLPIPATYAIDAPYLALADEQQNIYEFQDSESRHQEGPGIIISRPLHLSQRGGLVKIHKVILRGSFERRKISLLLYATRDYHHYHLIATSATSYITGITGTPYKAFKLAIIANLQPEEYISHYTIEFDETLSSITHF